MRLLDPERENDRSRKIQTSALIDLDTSPGVRPDHHNDRGRPVRSRCLDAGRRRQDVAPVIIIKPASSRRSRGLATSSVPTWSRSGVADPSMEARSESRKVGCADRPLDQWLDQATRSAWLAPCGAHTSDIGRKLPFAAAVPRRPGGPDRRCHRPPARSRAGDQRSRDPEVSSSPVDLVSV